jgi:hypothetical protein
MWWSLLQGTIFFLVIAVGIHEDWGSLDGSLPVTVGVMLAYGVTWSLSRLSDWHAKWKRRHFGGQERLQKERSSIR